MLSYEITSVVGKHKARKRVGRGPEAVTAKPVHADTREA